MFFIFLICVFLSFNSLEGSIFAFDGKKVPQEREKSEKNSISFLKLEKYYSNPTWHVSLVLYGIHFCEGTLIREDVVLTSGTCLGDSLRGNPKFKAHISTTSVYSGGFLIPVAGFRNYEMNNYYYGIDIGLVFLNYEALSEEKRNEIDFKKLIPIALPTEPYPPPTGTEVIINGHGILNPTKAVVEPGSDDPLSIGTLTERLLQAKVDLIPIENCQRLYSDQLTGFNSFCVESTDENINACQLDQGGPLIYNGTLIGVNSLVAGCTENKSLKIHKKPGLYSSVYPAIKWILRVINE